MTEDSGTVNMLFNEPNAKNETLLLHKIFDLLTFFFLVLYSNKMNPYNEFFFFNLA